jgi:hypothetical protein
MPEDPGYPVIWLNVGPALDPAPVATFTNAPQTEPAVKDPPGACRRPLKASFMLS